MDHSEIIDKMGGTPRVAARAGVRMASVSEWRRNGIPPLRLIELGAEIERVVGISRRELRPHDWHVIWPELQPAPSEVADAA